MLFRSRKKLEIPEDLPGSFFFEQYDSEPVIDLENGALIEELKSDLGIE